MRAFLLLLSACFAAQLSAAQPNILHIHADDHRADGLGALGAPGLITPHLDTLVARGMTFTRAYTQGSMIGAVCTPSRTMMLTGRSWQRIPGAKAARPEADNHATFLPSVLAAAGYRTWHMGNGGNAFTAGVNAFQTNIIDDARSADDPATDRAHASARLADRTIGFLKEQQWTTDFALETVQPRELRESVSAPATVQASGNGAAEVVAPASGTLRAAGAFPSLGMRVARGQTLAMLVPRLGGDADVASLQAALSSASSQATLADAEAARMQRLHAQEAVSLRRLQEARATQQVAAAELRAARQRLSQLGDGSSGIALKAPASGTLALVKVANGAAVEEGDALFHIVDRRELWLQANVAEVDAARLERPDAVAFDVPGFTRDMVVMLQGFIVLFSGAMAYVAAPWLARLWALTGARRG